MNCHSKRFLAIILAGLCSTLILCSCGEDPEAQLGEASDRAKNSNENMLDGRGTPKPNKNRDDVKKPERPTPPVTTTPAADEKEEDPKKDDKKNVPADDKKDDKKKKPEEKQPSCGDGQRDKKTEECDDGNRDNGDGCNSNCMSEATIAAVARTVLDVGPAHVCFIDGKSAQLKCWGFNDFGQLGRGNTDKVGNGTGDPVSRMAPVDLGNGLSSELVAAGGDSRSSSTCVINNRNEIKCFGDNSAGQLGIGSTSNFGDSLGEMGNNLGLVNIGSKKAIDLDSGARHQCALLDNGDVKCWGLNDAGQLGQGNTNNIGDNFGEMGSELKAIPIGNTAIALAVGDSHSCVITSAHQVKCWGLNMSGQLGQDGVVSLGDTPYEVAALSPVFLGQGRQATALAAGKEHTCAILDTGAVKCWGKNSSGQLGLDHRSNMGDGVGEMAALATVNLGLGHTATAIAAGDNFSCALLDDGGVKCWGENLSGQLGQESNLNLGDDVGEMSQIHPINLGQTARYIAAGGSTACALLTDGGLRCWGENSSGQLGINTTEDIGDNVGEIGRLSPIEMGF